MKIAIVGSGISGLVAAHLLHSGNEISVFEKNSYVGGHTNTVHVDLPDEKQDVDTGFIVFNKNHYPNFTKLLKMLNIDYQPALMNFGVHSDRSGIEYSTATLNSLFAQRRNLVRGEFWRLVMDILRFVRTAKGVLEEDARQQTVEEFLSTNNYSVGFRELFLIPLGSALWSCPAGRFEQFPIRFVIEFMNNHQMLQIYGQSKWSVIRGGSYRYVEKLSEPFNNRIRLRTAVKSITRSTEEVRLDFGEGETGYFDHVILACHADQALKLLGDPSNIERDILSAFPYQKNEAVLHTDESVLPKCRRAWASWNYHVPQAERAQSTVTYYMNRLQSLKSKHVFNVTLNETAGIAPERIVREITYEHPVYSVLQADSQGRHGELIRNNRTSFCGAYWGYGFHEDGVNSALAVCKAFGKSL